MYQPRPIVRLIVTHLTRAGRLRSEKKNHDGPTCVQENKQRNVNNLTTSKWLPVKHRAADSTLNCHAQLWPVSYVCV